MRKKVISTARAKAPTVFRDGHVETVIRHFASAPGFDISNSSHVSMAHVVLESMGVKNIQARNFYLAHISRGTLVRNMSILKQSQQNFETIKSMCEWVTATVTNHTRDYERSMRDLARRTARNDTAREAARDYVPDIRYMYLFDYDVPSSHLGMFRFGPWVNLNPNWHNMELYMNCGVGTNEYTYQQSEGNVATKKKVFRDIAKILGMPVVPEAYSSWERSKGLPFLKLRQQSEALIHTTRTSSTQRKPEEILSLLPLSSPGFTSKEIIEAAAKVLVNAEEEIATIVRESSEPLRLPSSINKKKVAG